MVQTTRLQDIREHLSGIKEPVVSVCLSVTAAHPENQGRGYLLRLKEILEELEVPDALAKRIYEKIEHEERPGARTVIFYATEDGLFERYDLQIDLPEFFDYGDPNLAPLALALDEHETYGVAVLDAEEFYFYVTAPMEAPGRAGGEETSGFYREVKLDPSTPYPRGGSDYEPASRRTEANVSRFYNELGEVTRNLAFREGVRHLIIAGPKERPTEFRKRLPQELKDRVAAEAPVPQGVPEADILRTVEEVREKAEKKRKQELLEEAREKGVRGVRDTLEALQDGRVHHLLAAWDLDAEVRWSDEDGMAILDVTSEKSPYTGSKTRARPLSEILVDLAAARGARLEFLRSENPAAATPNEDEQRGAEDPAGTLLSEFDGLVGLLRY